MSLIDFLFKHKQKKPPLSKSLELKDYILSRAISSGNINVLEAGASGGEDTLEWASFKQVSTVYAFEPVNSSFDVLTEKTKGNPKIKIYQMALSESPGTTTIHISTNVNNPSGLPSSSSILKPTGHLEFHKNISFLEKQEVMVTTLDQWSLEQGIKKLDILWLDMQGNEHKALDGGSRILHDTQLVYTEVSLKPMYEGSLLYPDFKLFMQAKGFEVEKEFLHWEDMGNVLFRKMK